MPATWTRASWPASQAGGVAAGDLVTLASALGTPLVQTPEAPRQADPGVPYNADGYFLFIGPADMPTLARDALAAAIRDVVTSEGTKSHAMITKAFGGPAVLAGVAARAPGGIAATEAANSAVSGANLIPVLSLGIPGNAAAVFLILAADSIGGCNPGPSVFRLAADAVNPELVIAFGLFASMMLANAMNWLFGGAFMRS